MTFAGTKPGRIPRVHVPARAAVATAEAIIPSRASMPGIGAKVRSEMPRLRRVGAAIAVIGCRARNDPPAASEAKVTSTGLRAEAAGVSSG